MNPKPIEVYVRIRRPIELIWGYFFNPLAMKKWNHASEDWETTEARVEAKEGGTYFAKMQAKDRSSGFDFVATFKKVIPFKKAIYVMDGGRKVEVQFHQRLLCVLVRQRFTPEQENSRTLQKQGWQAILNNFKRYVEAQD